MKSLLTIIALFTISLLQAVEKDSVLFSYGENQISLQEFIAVYKKSNLKKDDAFTESSIKEYLDLYINFKLKVQEALDTKFDTIPSVQAEIQKYRKQLAKSHLQDNNAYESLIREAYERKKKVRDVSHILIKLNQDANAKDSLEAYQKIETIYNKLIAGDDFSKLAKENSDDPSVKSNLGRLGAIQVLNFVYPFESMAYNTKVGTISKPFRTRFGYHILKVNSEEDNQGSLLTAHIFIKSSEKDKVEDQEAQKAKAQDIYQLIRLNQTGSSGLSFEEAVQKFSDDAQSKPNNGKIRWFGKGEMVAEYQEAAYKLNNIGDVSNPVKSPYGWHIIKLLDKKALGAYEQEKAAIKQKIVRTARKQIAEDRLLSEVKRENNYQFYQKNYDKLIKKMDESVLKNSFSREGFKGKWSKPLFKLGDNAYTQADFLNYVQKYQKSKTGKTIEDVLLNLYKRYVKQVCNNYQEKMLEIKDPSFKALMQEYHDGILLFEIMDRKVWNKAVIDTVGLEAFFNQNINNYKWKERIHTKIYNCNTKQTANDLMNYLNKWPNSADSSVYNRFNESREEEIVRIEEFKLEKGNNEHVDETNWAAGLHYKEIKGKNPHIVINNMLLINPEPKALKETKGLVISDYQSQLEEEWLKLLRKKYPVVVNDSLLKNVIK